MNDGDFEGCAEYDERASVEAEERDVDERIRQLKTAAADCARATTTALDRLILAEAVCRAAEALRDEGDLTGGVSTTRVSALRRALAAWGNGRPS